MLHKRTDLSRLPAICRKALLIQHDPLIPRGTAPAALGRSPDFAHTPSRLPESAIFHQKQPAQFVVSATLLVCRQYSLPSCNRHRQPAKFISNCPCFRWQITFLQWLSERTVPSVSRRNSAYSSGPVRDFHPLPCSASLRMHPTHGICTCQWEYTASAPARQAFRVLGE